MIILSNIVQNQISLFASNVNEENYFEFCKADTTDISLIFAQIVAQKF